MQEETLKNKTIKGVGWSAADAFLGQGVTFIVGLVWHAFSLLMNMD